MQDSNQQTKRQLRLGLGATRVPSFTALIDSSAKLADLLISPLSEDASPTGLPVLGCNLKAYYCGLQLTLMMP